MKKKLFFMLLGVLMVLPAMAHEFTYTYEGKTLIYTVIDEDAKTCMTKAGSPNTGDSYPGGNKLVSGNLVIPSKVTDGETIYTVTSIGYYAFTNTSLTSVTIPESVTSIDVSAFERCTSLTSVTIPESVTSIGSSVFERCTSLTSVTIPESVTSIEAGVFYGCTGLTSVTIPESVTSIGDAAFYGCTRLASVTIPESVTSIGFSAFQDCTRLASVTIPESVTSIGSSAFWNCIRLTKAEFASIEALCSIYFKNNYSNPLSCANHLYINGEEVIELVIPEGVESIGRWTFYKCYHLTSVTIPESVTSIGYSAFDGCDEITSVYYGADYPVSGDPSIFSEETYENATLYISVEAKDWIGYEEPWRSFRRIQVYDFSGIEEITVDFNADKPYDVYNLCGVKVAGSLDALTPGLYIVRQGKTVKKVAVK